MATLHPSSFRFHVTSLNEGAHHFLLLAKPGYKFLCSVQHHSDPRRRDASPPPISEHHARSRLASSLLRHHMHTPQGQALMALTNQDLPPSLISLAASHHLELLAATSLSVTYAEAHEDVLHRRIVQVKEREAREAVQEILFALVASKLLHAMLALPDLHRDATLATSEEQHTRQQDATLAIQPPCLDDMLQGIHAPDVQPFTSRHVAMVINGKNHAEDPVEPSTFAHVHKFELGKMYAASVMHGYFLARVHQRFKLEQRLQIEMMTPMEAYSHARFDEAKSDRAVSMEAYIHADGFQDEATIRRMSNLSCSLTLNVIEHHCEAMFGSWKSLQVRTSKDSNNVISIQLGFVRSLIYQALAFGALLWDMEQNFVPLYYPHIRQED